MLWNSLSHWQPKLKLFVSNVVLSLVYVSFQCSFLFNALNVSLINRRNWKVFKNAVLTAVILVKSFQIIKKHLTKGTIYSFYFFPQAPSEH